ncbi:MAG: hypothetical protein H6767_03680 [Candidatus Peribacteria bacterium]|nr:MAG: hypothetical protein H6767_03680 [Candidatus Peribacteria bacterium]
MIADGYNEEVDAYRDVIYNGKQWLAEYQSELVQGSGISNLKIKYT